MKYFISIEFNEQKEERNIFVVTKSTIDLISIGIVCERGEEYYAISKDFDIKSAWYKYQINSSVINGRLCNTKEYWLRDNVLRKIYEELLSKEYDANLIEHRKLPFELKSMKYLINKYGKTNEKISDEIKHFIYNCQDIHETHKTSTPIRFYGYYSAYDWVVLCCQYGSMLDLPKGFPKYCVDLKQSLDEIQEKNFGLNLFKGKLANNIKELPNYPKQIDKHNALADAKWNYKLYVFLKNYNNH